MKKGAIGWVIVLAGLTAAGGARADLVRLDQGDYLRALALNDEGQGARALPLLDGLRARYPQVLRYRFDYAAVAASSGEPAAALGAVDEALEQEAPRYVIDALYAAALALPDERRAERLQALLGERFADDAASGSRLVQLYLSLGHGEKALALCDQLLLRHPQREDLYDLRAYVLRQTGRSGEALLAYLELARRFPDNREAPKAIGMILADLGSPRLSSEGMARARVPLAIDESLRLASDRAVQHLRWAEGHEGAGERFRETDLAIAILVAARESALAEKAASASVERIRGELVVAYQARQRWADAVGEYEILVAGGRPIPAEVRVAAASCYGSLARYEEAEALLAPLVAADPDSVERKSAWVVALADLERYDEAQQVNDELIARLARTDLGNPAKASAYTSARVAQAMLFAYRDQLAEAEALLAALLKDAPGSLEATEASGIVATWRGHPRAAEARFRIVLGDEPDRLESKLGLGNARLDRGEASALRAAVDELGADYPPVHSVREARRRLELRDSYYVVANLALGADQDSIAGNHTREFDLKAYGKPFGDDRWRAFARYRDLWSGPEVKTSQSAVGGGLRYQVLDWTSEVEAGNKGYARFDTAYAFSDEWSADASFERHVLFRQARAVDEGVKANTAAAGLRWRRDEGLELRSGYRYTDFSDNRRSEAYVAVGKRLYTDFDRRLSAGARLSEQRNSNPAVAYFSPDRQTELSATLAFEFRQWQDLASKKAWLWHRVWATAGEVRQAGFATHSMTSVGYGQAIALSDSLQFNWSIARTRYPFDGVSSAYYSGNLGFEGYF